MPRRFARSRGPAALVLRMAVVIGAASGLGACAQLGGVVSEGPRLASKPDTPAKPKSELERATDHWGKEFDRNPRSAKAAVAYSQNLKAMGKRREALEILQTALIFNSTDRSLASEYGRLALEFGQVAVAERMLEVADDPRNPDWRIISARGTVLAKQGRYKEAIPLYERAASMAPKQASLLNNLALAHTMSGDAAKGEELLRQAAALGGAPKVEQNLAIVLGVQGRHDEAKSAVGEAGAEVASANSDFLRQMVRAPARPAPARPAPARPASVAGRAVNATESWAPVVTQVATRVPSRSAAVVAPTRPVALVTPAVVKSSGTPTNATPTAGGSVRGGVFELKPAQR